MLLVIKGNLCYAQNQASTIDNNSSTITFNIKHLGVLNVDGVFNDFSANIFFEKDVLKKIESTIQVKSINTNDQKRDSNLLEEEFLDVKTFPNINFSSSNITRKFISGILKIKAVEKDIKMSYSISKPDNKKYEISISTILSREKFELDFGSLNALLGDEIKVNIIMVVLRQ